MPLREINKAEWFEVRTARGRVMTGQQAHRTKLVPIDPANPTYVRGAGKTYYWCMGTQPDQDVIKKIARRCPIKAAEAYLAHYNHVPAGTWPESFVTPVERIQA